MSKIKELEKKINKARHDYYNHQPTVDDDVFDAWVDELTELDPDNESVTAIGADIVSNWPEMVHDVPMGSLNKVNGPDAFGKWAEDCETVSDIFGTEKLDGISINTIWKDGILVHAVTRGNGKKGEDILQNVRRMEGVPKKLKNFSGNIRGEIILRKSKFENVADQYSNVRNAASGIARRYDGKGSAILTVLFYEIADESFDTEQKQFDRLKSLGLMTPNHWHFNDVAAAIQKWQDYMSSERDKLDYDIDGLVLRVNDMNAQFALGEKSHRPKGAIAFKFDAPKATSILRKITCQVGNTGAITPVAEFDEVTLAGAKITRASLYNFKYVDELKVGPGAEVLIVRANDVIPRVEKCIKPGRKFTPPDKCPECSSLTKWNGEYLMCTNVLSCPAQTIGRLKIWIREQNILEWGDKVLKRLIDAELVRDVGDLYTLTADDIQSLERMGEKSAKNLVAIMDKHRNLPLENFVGGLGINGIGTSMVKLAIRAGYDTLDALKQASVSDFSSIDGFGDIKAEQFVEGLSKNSKRMDAILAAGVKIVARQKGVLTGKSFCFTGKSAKPRAELHKIVEGAGGDVKKSVGRGLNFLVLADPSSGSSKAKAAKKLGTKLISEDEFLKMVGM